MNRRFAQVLVLFLSSAALLKPARAEPIPQPGTAVLLGIAVYLIVRYGLPAPAARSGAAEPLATTLGAEQLARPLEQAHRCRRRDVQ